MHAHIIRKALHLAKLSWFLETMANQGIGNGLPLAAVVTTPEIASVMTRKIHFNTFGGNPVSSAGGKAVLEILDEEKRQEHCAIVGAHILDRLRKLKEKYDCEDRDICLLVLFRGGHHAHSFSLHANLGIALLS